jgi:PIN domain nuclease of toxin-antitoxin system
VTMKALLDTSALNWLADNPEGAAKLLAHCARGAVEVLVTLEAMTEILATPEPERRAQLESILAQFPLTPTRIGRLGAFRLGQARVALDHDMARLNELQFLHDGMDRLLAANAGGYACDVFVTCDREMSRDKRTTLAAALGSTRVLELEMFLAGLDVL